MRDIDDALAEIASVRQQMARRTTFRGFGPQVLILTAVLAVGAGIAQSPVAGGSVKGFIAWWSFVAAMSVGLIAAVAWHRARVFHDALAHSICATTALAFLPAGIAGAALALAVARVFPEAAPIIPGLWQVTLSLGVFAAAPSLPAGMRLVAGWYLISGVVCVLLAEPGGVPAPLMMALPFAIGQTIAASVFLTSERGRTDG
ncbi:MAG: hypothetical protein AAFV49_03895 [Pseudomonadota bacterium]